MNDDDNVMNGDAQGVRGLREEIAAVAAALIAEDGLDYAAAKRKAFEHITGGRGSRRTHDVLPTNEQIERAVRDYQAIYQSDTQPQRLLALRKKALALMQLIREFHPMVVGAVVNGTAGEHTDLHLHCFADNAKSLGIFLLNQTIPNEAAPYPHVRPGHPDVEAIALQWQGELAIIAVYPEHERRLSPSGKGHIERLGIEGLAQLIAQERA